MTLSINTNINSLVAQNNLTKSQSALSQATARLSSGLKINSASDNAAGYAIATNFTTQIGGLGQASSNASDAINLAQTTQSALSQVTANLQAIRDLAVQSANGSYTNADRASIDTEVQQRLAEITRIANQTDFNGQKVLDGSLGNLSFQVGANVGQTISVAVSQGVKTSQIGAVADVSTGDISSLFTAGTAAVAGTGGSTTGGTAAALTYTTGSTDGLTIGGTAITLAATYANTAALVTDINSKLSAAGNTTVTVSANGSGVLTATDSTVGSAAPTISGTAAPTAFGTTTATAGTAAQPATGLQALATEGLNINGTAISLTGVTSLQGLSDAINASNVSGVSAAVNAAGNGIDLFSSDTTKGLTIADTGGHVITSAATNVNTAATYVAGTTAAVGGSLSGGGVTTVDAANALISRIDVALNTVSNLNSTLGAIQNRFESTIATLGSQKDNLSSSRSTIQDADFAAETANLSKANILQQAGISVLAQANSQPQQVLKLLQ
ncbi:MAG: flagellin/flagellar hook associated protein [Pseudomonadota bacterium]|nr:flagellin/flagellar hook associated protein [Xanthomonadaceae bacterium]MDE2247449.1 flagellin/flagellar hook associated protein [Xanthomonadaceae bacterium]MDE3209289.1 flagellin/flagellar hook associated protein [Pseudomonadota bacterium]